MVYFDDVVAQTRTGWDVNLVGFVARLEFLGLEFLETLQAGLAFGLAPLGVAAYPFQFGLDRLLVGRLLALFLFQPLFLCRQPVRVVALVGNAPAAVQFQDPTGGIVLRTKKEDCLDKSL